MTCARLALTSVLWLLAVVLGTAATGAEEDGAALERRFQELNMDAKRLTGPLFWLHGDESKERLETYIGKVAIPSDVDFARCRVCLEMDDLPDDSAAVTVNGAYVGGVIGKPLRLDITRLVKPGNNTVLIEPLTPKAVRLVFLNSVEP